MDDGFYFDVSFHCLYRLKRHFLKASRKHAYIILTPLSPTFM